MKKKQNKYLEDLIFKYDNMSCFTFFVVKSSSGWFIADVKMLHPKSIFKWKKRKKNLRFLVFYYG